MIAANLPDPEVETATRRPSAQCEIYCVLRPWVDACIRRFARHG